VTAHHVVAHELAHIFLQIGDELKVNALAQTWIAEEAKAEETADELLSARLRAKAP
jgi:hypothetical protein